MATVTVIVLNYNGLDYLADCFASLTALTYPDLELMLVDNASSDGSTAYMQTHYPTVTLVQSDTNLGFAGGNNLGAAHATSDYVIFLNNDMRVPTDFVTHLVDAVHAAPDIVCVGAKILNWDGSQFDFTGSAGHFAGFAYQEGVGEPYDEAQYNESGPMLFACGGAMLIDRQIFLDVGGFDDDFFALFEDFDLGWRLWLLGYRVMFAPKAIAYHHHHGTLNKFTNLWKQVLYKRNSIYAALKNYSDENLGKILPTILLGSVAGLVHEAIKVGQLDLTDFDMQHPTEAQADTEAQVDDDTVSLTTYDAATLVAIYDVTTHLPQMMTKRQAIQSKRQRTDADIVPLFRWPFRFWPDVPAPLQSTLVEGFDVLSIFAGVPRRVVILAHGDTQALQDRLKVGGHTVLTAPDMESIPPLEPDVVIMSGLWLPLPPTVPLVLDAPPPSIDQEALRQADFITRPDPSVTGHLAQAGWTAQDCQERIHQGLTALNPFIRRPSLRLSRFSPPVPPRKDKSWRYLLGEIWRHYQDGGIRALSVESWAFFKRQVGW